MKKKIRGRATPQTKFLWNNLHQKSRRIQKQTQTLWNCFDNCAEVILLCCSRGKKLIVIVGVPAELILIWTKKKCFRCAEKERERNVCCCFFMEIWFFSSSFGWVCFASLYISCVCHCLRKSSETWKRTEIFQFRKRAHHTKQSASIQWIA